MKQYFIFVAVMALASGVWAHHSDAGIDMESIVAFDGVVSEFHFRNPHVYVLVDVENEAGETVQWDFQMGPVSVIAMTTVIGQASASQMFVTSMSSPTLASSTKPPNNERADDPDAWPASSRT